METTQVHVIYTGIIAIVPAAPPSGAMHMCIPNTSTAAHPHLPHVIAENDLHQTDLSKIGKCPPENGNLNAPHDLTAYSISGYRIEVASTVVSKPLRTRFDYFLDLAKGCSPVLPGCEQFNMSLLTGSTNSMVAASTLLARGILEASYVDPEYQWKFVDPDQGELMWLAQELVHSFEIEGELLTLCFHRESTKTMTIKAPDKSSPIEARIGNTLCEDIFPELRPPEKCPPEDRHVRMYHQLSSTPTPSGQRRKLVPVAKSEVLGHPPQKHHSYRLSGETIAQGPVPRDGTEPPRTVGGANCPPALFRS